ncbi:LOW QUALITY PROTEIN: hypothetical protein V2J09_010641 [Rumex salicifolius]
MTHNLKFIPNNQLYLCFHFSFFTVLVFTVPFPLIILHSSSLRFSNSPFLQDKKMGFLSFLLAVALLLCAANGQPLVPMLCIFGDSVADVGNNNNLYTLIKSNFPPYGRDFVSHKPTGRFCNGKLATDFTAENLGFTSYPPAYLSQEAKGKSLLTGVNFASAGSGYYDRTAQLYRAVSLTQQVAHYKEYQSKVVKMVGSAKANELFSGGIHILSAGGSDYLQNYYINPILYRQYTPDQFADGLMKSFSGFVSFQVLVLVTYLSTFILHDTQTSNTIGRIRSCLAILMKLVILFMQQALYGVGVKRIGVTSLPPLGCLPAAITLFGGGTNKCVDRLNRDAISFNNKLSSTSQSLAKSMPDLKLVVFDIYQPLLDMVTKPVDNGFFESRKACCGTGTIETSLLCNERSVGTCANATQYVFWDGFHPTEAANEILANDLLTQGLPLIGYGSSRTECDEVISAGGARVSVSLLIEGVSVSVWALRLENHSVVRLGAFLRGVKFASATVGIGVEGEARALARDHAAVVGRVLDRHRPRAHAVDVLRAPGRGIARAVRGRDGHREVESVHQADVIKVHPLRANSTRLMGWDPDLPEQETLPDPQSPTEQKKSPEELVAHRVRAQILPCQSDGASMVDEKPWIKVNPVLDSAGELPVGAVAGQIV